MYCLSSSNSAVERGFSILTMMLSDRRLKTLHDLMNFRIAFKINDRNWSEKERSVILRRALEIYVRKGRRKRKTDEASSNHTVELQSSESEDSQSDLSDYEFYNLSGKENSYNEQSDEDESLYGLALKLCWLTSKNLMFFLFFLFLSNTNKIRTCYDI